MNRVSIPFAIALLGSASLAQSRPTDLALPTLDKKFSVSRSEPAQQKKGDVGVWLGLDLRKRTDGPERLEVVAVVPGSPAEHAGAKSGDKLVALAGRPVSDHEALLDVLRGRKPGELALLTVERSRQIELAKDSDTGEQGLLGVTGDEAEGEKQAGAGVRITGVSAGDPASAAGLVAGERICAIDGQEVQSFAELKKKIQSHRPGDRIDVRTQRDLKVELAPRPALADDGRAVRGMGGDAFAPDWTPAAPKERAGDGLFEPLAKRGDAAPEPAQPKKAKPGTPKPAAPGLAPAKPKQAPPGTEELPLKSRAPKAATADQAMTAQLLDEIRALRKEVADLRRQIEALREQDAKKQR